LSAIGDDLCAPFPPSLFWQERAGSLLVLRTVIFCCIYTTRVHVAPLHFFVVTILVCGNFGSISAVRPASIVSWLSSRCSAGCSTIFGTLVWPFLFVPWLCRGNGTSLNESFLLFFLYQDRCTGVFRSFFSTIYLRCCYFVASAFANLYNIYIYIPRGWWWTSAYRRSSILSKCCRVALRDDNLQWYCGVVEKLTELHRQSFPWWWCYPISALSRSYYYYHHYYCYYFSVLLLLFCFNAYSGLIYLFYNFQLSYSN